MSSDQRRYSDEESALILQRAAEMQAQRGQQLSLTELESAAAEAGIDVALVRRAASEVATRPSTPPPPPPSKIGGGALGAPTRLVYERTISGPLGPTAWEDAMGEIHRQLGIKGQVDDLGRQFVWSHPQSRDLRISIAPRGDDHIVRVEEKLSGIAGGLFLGMSLPLTFASLGFIIPVIGVLLGMPGMIPVAFIAWAGLSFLLARTIYTSIARSRDRQARALTDGLVATLDAGSRSLPPAGD